MKFSINRALLAALALIFLLTAPGLALAQAAAEPEAGGADLPSAALNLIPESPAPRYGLDIIQAFGMFILVLGLLFITLKLIGRFSRFRAGKGRGSIFAMRGIMPLDNRKYLAAVEVEGHMLILGVTQDRVSPLAHWALASKAEPGAGDFAFHLRDDEDLPDISISEEQKGGAQ